MNILRRRWLCTLCASPLFATAANKLPGDSIYYLNAELTDQDGRAIGLDVWRGNTVLVSMFYSSCDRVCPMLIQTIKETVKALPAADRNRTRVLLVSFDPARDTVAKLKATAAAQGCDERWALARTDESSARHIAAVLGLQHRRLANGEFNHSSVIALLDTQGRIAARSAAMGVVDPVLLKAVRRVLVLTTQA